MHIYPVPWRANSLGDQATRHQDRRVRLSARRIRCSWVVMGGSFLFVFLQQLISMTCTEALGPTKRCERCLAVKTRPVSAGGITSSESDVHIRLIIISIIWVPRAIHSVSMSCTEALGPTKRCERYLTVKTGNVSAAAIIHSSQICALPGIHLSCSAINAMLPLHP
jgi:hypothetical protein